LQLYVERQKLTLKGEAKALDDDAVLAAAGVRDGSELAVKDLGPQISWKTVFLIEYVRLFSLSIHLPRQQTNKQTN
jgi:very-long-chain enoyl-CoA reductase